MKRKSKRQAQQLLLNWYEQMVLCYETTLSAEEREAIQEWDRTQVDGSGRCGTSDWPGWEKHIGKPPRPSQQYFSQGRRRA